MWIIDRRLNPSSRSLGNRQRFIRRARTEIREAVNQAIRSRAVTGIDGGEPIRARIKGVKEPQFSLAPGTGRRDFVVPGNRTFRAGDKAPKPPKGGQGGAGQEGSPDGEGEDGFVFTLTREEFLDIFFDDLALPNLLKKKLTQEKSDAPQRAGYATDGPPAKLSYARTMGNSLARRVALRRPTEAEIAEAEAARDAALDAGEAEGAAALTAKVEALRRRRRLVPYLDPLDLRYRRFERTPKPTTQAVMFCILDASASMTEPLKDLAKRFFMLLYLFLTKEYRAVDVVFIRHTTTAREVDEEAFFRGVDTGGTVVSSAFDLMADIQKKRYPADDWNIYCAQATDGHDFSDDLSACADMLADFLPLCQYFAYVEVSSPSMSSRSIESALWRAFSPLAESRPNFAMRRIASPEEILPVFRRLFARSLDAA
jgi:uncharacterized sporulation protein YeaH/YhbH (DUF444 family)